MGDSLLGELVGEELGSVVFVRDYVQFDFDGPRLTLLVWPSLVAEGEAIVMGEPGYRDALCGLIDQKVVATAENRDQGLGVDFGSAGLVIKPDLAEVVGPEIATLSGITDQPVWEVWRPGEFPFDTPEWTEGFR